MEQTLEQLENSIWGEPEYGSHLVLTCNRLRKKPIDQFTVEDLRIMLGQDIGTEYLMPKALEVLESNPFARGDVYQCSLKAEPPVCKGRTPLQDEFARFPTHRVNVAHNTDSKKYLC